MDNLAIAKKMLQQGEHTADILSATDWTYRNGKWLYREKKGKRFFTNYDLSKGEKKAIQKYIESLPEDILTSNPLYFENNGYIYKFNTSIVQYEDNRKSGRHGFNILKKVNLNKLTDEQRNKLQRGYERHPRSVARITDEYETSERSDLGDIHNVTNSTPTTRINEMVSGRIEEENSIGGRNSSESIQDSRDGEITPYDSKAGVNFSLSEEASNILDTIEQRNSEAYNSATRVELPEAVTPMEIARNKKMVVMFRHAKTIILLDDKYSH